MWPALFAVLGDFVTGGLVVGCALAPKPSQIAPAWPVSSRQRSSSPIPASRSSVVSIRAGEGLLNYGFSVDGGYFGGHCCSGRAGGCVRLRTDRAIWQVGKTRCRAADRAGAAGPAGASDPGCAQLGVFGVAPAARPLRNGEGVPIWHSTATLTLKSSGA